MSTEEIKQITFRPVKESDLNYIYSSWLEDYLSSHHTKVKTYKLQSHVALMPKNLYYKEQRELIAKILKKSKVIVACNTEDEEQIFGYIVYRSLGLETELTILSWVYVRPIYRSFGICKKLIEKAGPIDVVTHVTPARRWFLKQYNLIFNPYMEEKLDD